MVQIGTAEDEDKPQFAQLPADKSIETITLEEALELFKLPRQVGEFEGTTVTIGSGRFGPYVLHDRKYVSIPKEIDPMTITLEQAVKLINEKRSNEQKRHIKTFEEDNKLELQNGAMSLHRIRWQELSHSKGKAGERRVTQLRGVHDHHQGSTRTKGKRQKK